MNKKDVKRELERDLRVALDEVVRCINVNDQLSATLAIGRREQVVWSANTLDILTMDEWEITVRPLWELEWRIKYHFEEVRKNNPKTTGLY